jgi:hypothetical protein
MTTTDNNNPIPPLSNPITDKITSVIWNAYFTNLKAFIDKLAAATLNPPKHNDLSEIQGGTDTERYHLTEVQHNTVVQIQPFDGDNTKFVDGTGTLSVPDHNSLGGLQGGTNGERYHLTFTQFNTLDNIPILDGIYTHYYNGNGSFVQPTHNDLAGLQGGAAGDYQHVTTEQLADVAGLRSLIYGYASLGL